MSMRERYEVLPSTRRPLKPVPREEVEDYLARFIPISDQMTDPDRGVESVDWDAWRDLRADDYYVQYNLQEGRFYMTRDEYMERWRWNVENGHGWDLLDQKYHIIDTGFVVEGILRSRHTDEDGNHFTMPLCEFYHLQDGKAVYSTEYLDASNHRPQDERK